MKPTLCPSGKWWFRDERDADISARKDEQQYGWKMRSYQCPDCGWWHKAKVKRDGEPVLLLDELRRDSG